MKKQIHFFIWAIAAGVLLSCSNTEQDNPLDAKGPHYNSELAAEIRAGFSSSVDTTIASSSDTTSPDPSSATSSSVSSSDSSEVSSSSSSEYQVSSSMSSSENPSSVTVNSAPIISTSKPAGVTMSEDGVPTAFALVIDVSDADEDDLTWSIKTEAANGTAGVSGGNTTASVSYTPNANYNGSDSFIIEVSDGFLSDTIEVAVVIEPVNDAPIFASALTVSGTGSLNETLAIDPVGCNDVDVGDTETLSVEYQWYRDDNSSGEDGTLLIGETESTHIVLLGDVGTYLYAKVICTDTNNVTVEGFTTYTTISAPTTVPGALDFDGIPIFGDYVEIPEIDEDWSAGITIEVWIRVDSLIDFGRILDFGQGQGMNNIIVNTNDPTLNQDVGIHIYNGGTITRADAPNFIELNKWTHLAISITPSNVCKIYKNGVPFDTIMGIPLPDNVNRTSNFIAKSNWAENPGFFNGALDDVRIWNDVRLPLEIKDNRYTQLQGTEANLVANWTFNSDQGTIVWDISNNNYHGSLKNAYDGNEWIPQLVTHEVTVNTANGVTTPSGVITVTGSDQLSIQATPNPDYYFTGWSITSGTGTIADANAASTTITVTTDVTVTANFAPDLGNALVFDGVNDYVDLPDMNPDFSQGLTIEAWVYWQSSGDWSRIIAMASNENSVDNSIYVTSESTTTNLRFDVYNGAVEKNMLALNYIVPGVWTHVAVTIDTLGNGKIYKDGALHTSSNLLERPITTTRTANYIGRGHDLANKTFDGKIDEVRVWNICRTAQEINNNRYLSLVGTETGLVALWGFNESTGTNLSDASSSGFDGTLQNFPVDPWVPSTIQ